MSSEHGEFYLGETWGIRLMHLATAAVMLAIAAGSFCVALLGVLQSVLFLQAADYNWPLFVYAVVTVFGGVVAVAAARSFWDRLTAAFRRVVIRTATPTGAATIGPVSVTDAMERW